MQTGSERAVVIVTGASSGIGAALSVAWAKRGARVVLSGRNEVALERVAKSVRDAGGEALTIAGDVTKEPDRVTLIERTRKELGRLDVLVNNAGRGYYAQISAVDPKALADLFDLNVIAPLRLAQLALDDLGWTRGTVVMMSSVAGVVSTPRIGAYAATKFALEAVSMALRAEIASQGVRVVVVRPGPVDTPFRANAQAIDGGIGFRPKSARAQTAEAVAEMTIAAVERNRAVLETSRFVRVASLAARIAPAPFRWLSVRMAAR